MNLLIWLASCCLCLCLASAAVAKNKTDKGTTMLEQHNNGDDTDEDDDDDDCIGDAISKLEEHFGGQTYTMQTAMAEAEAEAEAEAVTATEAGNGFYNEMEAALEHATDTADGLWQQFKKGLLSLMGSFSNGSDDKADKDNHDNNVVGITVAVPAAESGKPSLQHIKPVATATNEMTVTTANKDKASINAKTTAKNLTTANPTTENSTTENPTSGNPTTENPTTESAVTV